MKQLSAFCLLVLTKLLYVTPEACAQDLLVKEDGTTVKAWDVDMGATKIYYKSSNSATASLKSIDKKDVMVWKKVDGTRVFIDKDGNDSASQSKTPQLQMEIKENQYDDPVVNKKAIDKYNNHDITWKANPYKKKNPSWSGVLSVFRVDETSKMLDKNVEIELDGLCVYVKNKTNKPIYLLLGNSSYVTDYVAKPFSLMSTEQTAGQMSSSSSTSVVVPPQTKYHLINIDGSWNSLNWTIYGRRGGGKNIPKPDEVQTYTPDDSPLTLGLILTYSLNEDYSHPIQLNAQFYIAEEIGLKSKFHANGHRFTYHSENDISVKGLLRKVFGPY